MMIMVVMWCIISIKDALWECYGGTEHGELVAVLALLQRVDERPYIHGLTAPEHIKLLKKAKSACPGNLK